MKIKQPPVSPAPRAQPSAKPAAPVKAPATPPAADSFDGAKTTTSARSTLWEAVKGGAAKGIVKEMISEIR